MLQQDSVDKVVSRYLATVARTEFTYEKIKFNPKILKVSPLLLRDYTCPPGCSGCCFRFTLDYLPSEKRPPEATLQRWVTINGKKKVIWTDPQIDNETKKCRNVLSDGRCGIYQVRPFTCDFELIRTLQNEDDDRANVLTQKLFGRGWSYQRSDGGKGALCEMTPVTKKSIAEVIRKLKRLEEWAVYFEIDTWIPDLIKIIEEGRLTQQISFYPPGKKVVGFGL